MQSSPAADAAAPRGATRHEAGSTSPWWTSTVAADGRTSPTGRRPGAASPYAVGVVVVDVAVVVVLSVGCA